MSTLTINYDKQFDVMYLRSHVKDATYADEDDSGVVTLRKLTDDSISGVVIYDFKKRFNGNLAECNLPFPIDFTSDGIISAFEC